MNPPTHDDPAFALFEDSTKRLESAGLAIGAKAGSTRSVADARRRRMSQGPADDAAAYLTLVRGADGLLDWRCDGGPALRPQRAGRRRAARRGPAGLFDEVPINQALFRPVEGSKVSGFLASLDQGFNPRHGLFDLQGQAVTQIAPQGRVLLIVHGTFSKCAAIVDQLNGIADASGRQLLTAATARYQQVLLYEHPTLQLAPWINGLDLARAFAGSRAQVDIVCHSRGGLVTRWWLEVFQRELLAQARVVFVASPLMGTGLASPYRLRTALKLMTNYASAMSQVSALAATALPVFTVMQGLATLVGSASGLLARSPLADAAVAMVPGLAAMSRYGPDSGDFIRGNVELEKLSFGWQTPPTGYFAVTSNFETEAVGWQFWKAFRGAGLRLADAGTDAIFSGANDLVVDTASMTNISVDAAIDDAGRRHDYGTNAVVHHLNYFSQSDTVAFIRKALVF